MAYPYRSDADLSTLYFDRFRSGDIELIAKDGSSLFIHDQVLREVSHLCSSVDEHFDSRWRILRVKLDEFPSSILQRFVRRVYRLNSALVINERIWMEALCLIFQIPPLFWTSLNDPKDYVFRDYGHEVPELPKNRPYLYIVPMKVGSYFERAFTVNPFPVNELVQEFTREDQEDSVGYVNESDRRQRLLKTRLGVRRVTLV